MEKCQWCEAVGEDDPEIEEGKEIATKDGFVCPFHADMLTQMHQLRDN
jgi:hypothetical protein